MLIFIKYCWVDMVLRAANSRAFGLLNKEHLFLFLVGPISFTTAVGHGLQLAARGYSEAIRMEVLLGWVGLGLGWVGLVVTARLRIRAGAHVDASTL